MARKETRIDPLIKKLLPEWNGTGATVEEFEVEEVYRVDRQKIPSMIRKISNAGLSVQLASRGLEIWGKYTKGTKGEGYITGALGMLVHGNPLRPEEVGPQGDYLVTFKPLFGKDTYAGCSAPLRLIDLLRQYVA